MCKLKLYILQYFKHLFPMTSNFLTRWERVLSISILKCANLINFLGGRKWSRLKAGGQG